jgi:hypothetical protein
MFIYVMKAVYNFIILGFKMHVDNVINCSLILLQATLREKWLVIIIIKSIFRLNKFFKCVTIFNYFNQNQGIFIFNE